MSKNISKYFNFRILLLVVCLIAFILLNSSQESYESINDIPVSTLTTTNIGNFNTTSDPFSTTSGPTYPTATPPTPSNGGITQTEKPSISSRILPISIGVAILILVFMLYIRKRKEVSLTGASSVQSKSTISTIRQKFSTQIVTLVDVLEDYLKKGNFAEGIIFGYHQLDKNMKLVLGIKRETYLTPKEFSLSLDLPEILPHFKWIIDIFYVARYRISQMTYDNLEQFILELKTIKDLSGKGIDIQISQIKKLGDVE